MPTTARPADSVGVTTPAPFATASNTPNAVPTSHGPLERTTTTATTAKTTTTTTTTATTARTTATTSPPTSIQRPHQQQQPAPLPSHPSSSGVSYHLQVIPANYSAFNSRVGNPVAGDNTTADNADGNTNSNTNSSDNRVQQLHEHINAAIDIAISRHHLHRRNVPPDDDDDGAATFSSTTTAPTMPSKSSQTLRTLPQNETQPTARHIHQHDHLSQRRVRTMLFGRPWRSQLRNNGTKMAANVASPGGTTISVLVHNITLLGGTVGGSSANRTDNIDSSSSSNSSSPVDADPEVEPTLRPVSSMSKAGHESG